MPSTQGHIARIQIAEGVSVRAPGLIVDAEPLRPGDHPLPALEAMAPAGDFAVRESAAIQAHELTPYPSADASAIRLRVSRPALALAEALPRLATPTSKRPHVELSVDAAPGDHVLARVQRGKVVQWYLPILPHPVHALRAAGPQNGPVRMSFAIPAPMAQPAQNVHS